MLIKSGTWGKPLIMYRQWLIHLVAAGSAWIKTGANTESYCVAVRVPWPLTEQGREPVTSRLMLYLYYTAPINESPIYIQITMYGSKIRASI